LNFPPKASSHSLHSVCSSLFFETNIYIVK
jgi:hypothetical protein